MNLALANPRSLVIGSTNKKMIACPPDLISQIQNLGGVIDPSISSPSAASCVVGMMGSISLLTFVQNSMGITAMHPKVYGPMEVNVPTKTLMDFTRLAFDPINLQITDLHCDNKTSPSFTGRLVNLGLVNVSGLGYWIRSIEEAGARKEVTFRSLTITIDSKTNFFLDKCDCADAFNALLEMV